MADAGDGGDATVVVFSLNRLQSDELPATQTKEKSVELGIELVAHA